MGASSTKSRAEVSCAAATHDYRPISRGVTARRRRYGRGVQSRRPDAGRGGRGQVVQADSTDSQSFKRLLREAQAYGRLKPPNIVTVYEAREAADGLYIAMEYLEGQSLTTVLNRDDLALAARIDVLIQILDALKYAHAQGIVHRDIKPSNIHVLADGTVKLLDFGLARVMRPETLT